MQIRVPWNATGNYDKRQHETRGYCERQCMVQWMIFPFYRKSDQEENIFQELERPSHNLGSRNHEVHWRWSSALLCLQKLGSRWRHNFGSLLCKWMEAIVKFDWFSQICCISFCITYTICVLNHPPYLSSSICGRSQWYRVTKGWIPDWKNSLTFKNIIPYWKLISNWCFSIDLFPLKHLSDSCSSLFLLD